MYTHSPKRQRGGAPKIPLAAMYTHSPKRQRGGGPENSPCLIARF